MKVKTQQLNAMDAMTQMMDPSTWSYYNNPDLWDLVGSDPNSPDSDSDHEDDANSPMMPGYQGGTPAEIAALASMTGMPVPPGGYGFENIDMTGPLSNSEKDVLNELVHELGIVNNQVPAVLPSVTATVTPGTVVASKPATIQPSVALAYKPQTTTMPLPSGSNSKPSVVVTVKHDTRDKSKSKASKPKTTIKRERPPTPDLEDILAKPVKSQKAVDVDAVMERNRKNAIQARINRQKKKQQVDLLEDRITELEEDKRTLEIKCDQQERDKEVLHQEILYLRSVLANQSALAGLLKNVKHTEGVLLHDSGVKVDRKRVSENGEDPTVLQKRSKVVAPGATAGVCLHVDSDVVSLEFCEKCARMAKTTAVSSSTSSTSGQ